MIRQKASLTRRIRPASGPSKAIVAIPFPAPWNTIRNVVSLASSRAFSASS